MKHLISFDWAMKKLLRSKANFGILEGFLSELLKQDLKILNLLESESNKNHQDDKQNRVDILVQLQSGEIVLVEVQVNTELDYFHRMLYGTSKIITDYLESGKKYQEIKKVYSVNILYFDLGHGKDYIYHGITKFIGLHEHDELSLSEKQRDLYTKECIHEIYPEYYLIKLNQFNDIAKNTLDEWIYFLKNEEIKDSFHAKGLLEAKDKFSALKMTDIEKWEYEGYIKARRIQTNEIESSHYSGIEKGKIEGEKIGIEKGKIEGEQIGIEKGKIEGEQIGIEKGKIEGEQIGIEKGEINAKVEVAKKMKGKGMPIEDIRDITGLSIEELGKL
jgi:predicted transposase/invertase (TIGR01784 family)